MTGSVKVQGFDVNVVEVFFLVDLSLIYTFKENKTSTKKKTTSKYTLS